MCAVTHELAICPLSGLLERDAGTGGSVSRVQVMAAKVGRRAPTTMTRQRPQRLSAEAYLPTAGGVPCCVDG